LPVSIFGAVCSEHAVVENMPAINSKASEKYVVRFIMSIPC